MSRRVVAIAITVVLLLLVLWWIGLKSPQSKAIQRAHAQAAAAVTKSATLQSQANDLLRQKAQLPAVQAELAALKVALPPQAALAQVIDSIHQAAAASGIELQSLSQSVATSAAATSTTPAAGGLQEVSLTISASGAYPKLVEFVTQLNLLARTTVVDNLSLTVGPSANQLIAAISGRMFFVPVRS